MSTSTLAVETSRAVWMARLADYVELTKPRVSALVLVSVGVAGFAASWDVPSPRLLALTLLGTALVAASASALNQWLERDSDALMERTADRPLPAGRLTSGEVFWFGIACAVLGLLGLATLVSLLTASIGLATWFLYVWVYTPLKSRTAANTAIGAVAGAMPVLMGWSAVSRDPLALDSEGLLAATLFLIVFLWQFPHFMSIAWIYRDEYAKAGLRMLPVVDASGRRAARQAMVSALALIPVSLVPAALRMAGPLYMAAALTLGLVYLGWAVYFGIRRDDAAARGLLRASLVYLPALLALFMLFPGI